MFENALKLLQKYDTIIIHRHSRPDGDAIGSQVGLKHLITDNFPNKKVFAVGDNAGRYGFMDDCIMDEIDDSVYSGALAIVLDTSAKALISDSRYELAEKTLRIDHHIFCEEIANEEVVDTSFESCCGLVAYFAKECGLKLSPISAKSLFTGMVTDSGRFRYDSTSSRTFELASFLTKEPFDVEDIYNNLYVEEYEMVKLRSNYFLKMQRTDNGVGYVYTTKDEVKEMGCDVFTISRGMVNTMAGIKGVDIWVNFTEDEDNVLCEIRSGSLNINPVAVKYGGGGHAKASGATLVSREQAFQLLDDLNNLLEKGND